MADPPPHSAASAQTLRSALKSDDGTGKTPPASGSLKAVHIEEPVPEASIEEETQPPRQFRAPPARRLSGKFTPLQGSPALRPVDDSSSHHHHRRQYYSEKLLAQVGDWLEHERKKVISRAKPRQRRKSRSPPLETENVASGSHGRDRSGSVDSQSSEVSFERLQHILEESMAAFGLSSIPKHVPKYSRYRHHRQSSSRSGLQRAASSDTDYVDGDAIVPSCDAWLDNSKTLSYNMGSSTENLETDKAEKEKEAWLVFKNEIIRITHTLRIKGWRRVELGSGDKVWVERLSGALTNAVYVVTPPKDLPAADGKKIPSKILLRIYGPQVEHLIDRENELKVLQRLARKKIGPRLLGTFKNGRFEQFFNAITLTPLHLREPETSRQIAKRMRELHDGVELLPQERENGPNVWRNWDQWRDNVTRIVSFLDQKLENSRSLNPRRASVHAWLANGYVCGASFKLFTEVVNRYRDYLNSVYKNSRTLNDRLIFAHNDTQYGNILRIRPDDEKSPLLQAANKHKQLVVIDFEYAAANVPGLEFANHFTEWTYNYHDPVTSYACNTPAYPTVEEQRRFVKAYVDHRPQFPSASATPKLSAQDSGSSAANTPLLGPARSGSISSLTNTPSFGPTTSSSSIVDFMLDARVPQGEWTAAERAREEESDKQVRELLEEARLWRPANSVMWVAWGIVQAKVPGLEEKEAESTNQSDVCLEADEDMGADEFDYLSYSQDRALFFWGDVVQMGLVKPEELPETLRARLKIVEC